VVDPDHDRQAGVRPACLGPATGDVGKVLDVEADQGAPFCRRQRQQRLVVPAVQLAFLVDRADLVSRFSLGN